MAPLVLCVAPQVWDAGRRVLLEGPASPQCCDVWQPAAAGCCPMIPLAAVYDPVFPGTVYAWVVGDVAPPLEGGVEGGSLPLEEGRGCHSQGHYSTLRNCRMRADRYYRVVAVVLVDCRVLCPQTGGGYPQARSRRLC